MAPEFRLIDYVAIGIFTYLFYTGIVGLLIGSFVGGLVLFLSWELWNAYLRWRVKQ